MNTADEIRATRAARARQFEEAINDNLASCAYLLGRYRRWPRRWFPSTAAKIAEVENIRDRMRRLHVLNAQLAQSMRERER